MPRRPHRWPDPPPTPPPTPAPASPPPPTARPGDAYFCRRCGAGGDGPVAPPGWLRLQRRGDGQRDSWRPWQTLGLFCSATCLAADAGQGGGHTAAG
jgi:hypothetical protein